MSDLMWLHFQTKMETVVQSLAVMLAIACNDNKIWMTNYLGRCGQQGLFIFEREPEARF